jgi:hypothetical protein
MQAYISGTKRSALSIREKNLFLVFISSLSTRVLDPGILTLVPVTPPYV